MASVELSFLLSLQKDSAAGVAFGAGLANIAQTSVSPSSEQTAARRTSKTPQQHKLHRDVAHGIVYRGEGLVLVAVLQGKAEAAELVRGLAGFMGGTEAGFKAL